MRWVDEVDTKSVRGEEDDWTLRLRRWVPDDVERYGWRTCERIDVRLTEFLDGLQGLLISRIKRVT